jgi:Cytosol aminopeptidase family, N-terminal domain
MTRFQKIGAMIALLAVALGLATIGRPAAGQVSLAKHGDEKSFVGPHGLTVKVRVQVPQEQEADLLFLCFFKHKEKGDRVLDVIEKFDERLGGLIASLRNRGEFGGNELETILIVPPPGSIKAKRLMLIGLGEEEKLSLATMRRIGTVAMREAARLGVKTTAFGAAIRDQGNTEYPTGDVAREVIEGAILAFDTEKRLQKEGLGAGLALEEWILLAGPKYYNEVAPEAEKSVAAARAAVKARPDEPYAKRP